MSIDIGVIEFFAFTIPGIIYAILIGFVLVGFDVYPANLLSIKDLSLGSLAVFAVLAYVLGTLLDPIAKKVWYRFFEPNNVVEAAYDEFVSNLEGKRANFTADAWVALSMRIKKDNPGVAARIERYSASRIMLRNVSFALIILSVMTILLLFVRTFSIPLLLTSLLSLVLSVVAGKESAKFHIWFYLSVFQATLAYGLEGAELITGVRDSGDDE